MMHKIQLIGLFLLTFALVACGFHLRGSYELPEHLSPVYLDKESMSLQLFRELRSTMKLSGAELTEDSTEAASVLKVDFEQQTRDVISVDTLGRAREYRLIYRLTFSLLTGEDVAIDGSRIELTRNLLFNPETVLGVAEETEIIYNDIIADSARQIVQRMQALK
ncbi:MAG: LPS assembly lipoprotein LptE [Gammaproteobacteria bacterium]